MPVSKTKAVIFQPTTHQVMLRGVNQMVNALRCTLGPMGGYVMMNHTFSDHKPPELLDSGGVISRRIIQLADRDEDMGAMLARAMIQRQQDRFGDGTATAAVLFQAIFEHGVRYIVSGGNAMRLRKCLQKALLVATQMLDGMKRPVEGQRQLTRVAEAICHDPELAARLGEIFDTIGAYGQLDIRKHYERGLKHEYVEGMYWHGGLQSRQMIADPTRLRTELENVAVFISDYEVKQAEELVPVLETALQNDIQALVIVTRSLSEQATAFLLANSSKLGVIAVKAPGENADDHMAALEDLSILTGGTPFLKIAGQTTRQVTAQAFGRARRAWATHQNFGVVGGRGNPRELRRHLATLEARFQNAQDAKMRNALQERIGKLMGGSATLWIGGATETEVTVRKALAERAARALREAVRDGVLPGGGIALLKCRAVLERTAAGDTDQRAAYRILARAVAEPARAILANAGFDPGKVIVQLSSDCDGFDVMAGQIINTMQAGLLDVASVQKGALQNAVLTAGLALTIDVLVHHRTPQISPDPG